MDGGSYLHCTTVTVHGVPVYMYKYDIIDSVTDIYYSRGSLPTSNNVISRMRAKIPCTYMYIQYTQQWMPRSHYCCTRQLRILTCHTWRFGACNNVRQKPHNQGELFRRTGTVQYCTSAAIQRPRFLSKPSARL